MDKIQLFNKIIEAAEKDTDNLGELLRIAIEQEDEHEVDLLLAKIYQIMNGGSTWQYWVSLNRSSRMI